jgi:H+-transporting ATPase
MEVLSSPLEQEFFGLATQTQLQTLTFLQLVAGGHLLLFITRTERWFFLRPFPAAPLFWAILLTQILAILMCALGWLVEPISWQLIAWIWGYNLVWMFLLGAIRLITERFADYRTVRHLRSSKILNQSLHSHI